MMIWTRMAMEKVIGMVGYFIYLKNEAKRTFANKLNLSCGSKREVKGDPKDLVLAREVLY